MGRRIEPGPQGEAIGNGSHGAESNASPPVGLATGASPRRTDEIDRCGQLEAENARLGRVCASLQERVRQLESGLLHARRLADQDPLTGLANRRLLGERFVQAAALARRHATRLAVLFLDLDRFKRVNDELGHAIGDEFLHRFAARLSTRIRASDTACRYGGDEFVVVLTGIDRCIGADSAVSEILAQLAAPYAINGGTVQVAVSHGIALFPDDGTDLAALIAFADSMMYRHKERRTCVGEGAALPGKESTGASG